MSIALSAPSVSGPRRFQQDCRSAMGPSNQPHYCILSADITVQNIVQGAMGCAVVFLMVFKHTVQRVECSPYSDENTMRLDRQN
jgi:hypothetical protein